MPRLLLVMRHGKSSWDDEKLPDHQRPLTKRGKRDSRYMGEALRARDLMPDIVLSSTATRAQRTVRQFVKGSDYEGDVISDESLYLGEVTDHLRALRHLPSDVHRTLMIGHNPALEELVRLLTGQEVRLPTASVACITLPIENWDQINEKTRGTLECVLSPKELQHLPESSGPVENEQAS